MLFRSRISENIACNNRDGISISHSINVTLSGNNANDDNRGIKLYDSINVTLSGNIAVDNDYGFYLSGSNNITLFGNIAFNNDYGIHLSSSSNNTIYFNEIYGNKIAQANVIYGSTNNQWDNGTTGNYWGKHYLSKYPAATNDGTVWDTPYEIDGDEIGIDHFPLVNPIFPDDDAPLLIISPKDWRDRKSVV